MKDNRGVVMNTIKNIFCIGRNYVEHVHELGNVVPEEPVVFTKPSHSLFMADGQRLTLPSDEGDVHYEAELVLKLGRDYEAGISVDDIVSEMTVGLDLTLRDVQSRLKEKGQPWLLAKGFTNAAVLGKFVPFTSEKDCEKKNFTLHINDELVQEGDIKKMIFPLARQIEFLGEKLGLKKGDIIFTGTPECVGPLREKDSLLLSWGDEALGKTQVSFK